ncbi:MAG TPA: FHA domain-containing protein [Gemmatimonadales bacterium]|nr:FHA domain-containing protein [Gemmatimonadales bacterium]
MDEVTWLEVVHRREGVVERRRLDGHAFVVGRGYAADVIVDDPQVCATHLRVARDDAGVLLAEDLDSVNGTWDAQRRRIGRAVLHSGATLRIGQTELRFIGPDTPVPSTERAGARGWRRLLEPRFAPALALVAGAAAALEDYLGGFTRLTGAKATGVLLGFVLLLLGYAGAWAFVSRVTVRAFNFRRHLTIASLATVGTLALSGVTGYLAFGLPDRAPLELAVAGLWSGVLGLVLSAHLASASRLTRPRRLKVLGALAAVAVVFAVVGALNDEFSATPRFDATIKPVGTGLVPMTSVDEFVAEGTGLAKAVDKLAAEPRAGR